MNRVYSVSLQNRHWANDKIEYWVLARNAQQAASKALRKAGRIFRVTAVSEVGEIDIF
jgi:hypothetical protein